jgi:uncharacterized protein YdaU (DUF1376 family)
MSKAWMPLYIADYRADTAHLSAAQHGAYLCLIMHYWSTGALPQEDAALARIACMTPSEWKRNHAVIAGFFTSKWTHKRIDKELAKAKELSNKRSASAKQRSSNSSAKAQQSDTQSQSQSQSQKNEEDAPSGASSPVKLYAFESGVIRLNERDFEQWKASYTHLDVGAELLAMTEWAGQQRSWFNAVKGALTKKNQQAKERKEVAAKKAEPQWLDGIPGVI